VKAGQEKERNGTKCRQDRSCWLVANHQGQPSLPAKHQESLQCVLHKGGSSQLMRKEKEKKE
jgi:hypothetical protein